MTQEKMVNELEKMVTLERQKLLKFAKRLIPYLTAEDILQPQDYPELDQNLEFRYQEGLVIGLETALSTLYAIRLEK